MLKSNFKAMSFQLPWRRKSRCPRASREFFKSSTLSVQKRQRTAPVFRKPPTRVRPNQNFSITCRCTTGKPDILRKRIKRLRKTMENWILAGKTLSMFRQRQSMLLPHFLGYDTDFGGLLQLPKDASTETTSHPKRIVAGSVIISSIHLTILPHDKSRSITPLARVTQNWILLRL